MAITFWRNVQRKITTQEMDASFDTLVNDIANAGISSEMPEGTIYIGDNTNTASLETLDTSIVPETTDKRYQSDLQDTYNDATSSIQGQLDSKQTSLGYTPENSSNKTDTVTGNEANSIKYLSVKGVYDWATGLFATISNLALKSNIASPTFTGTVTTPDINISGATASTIAHFDASKNIESLPTATYPNLTELSYVKGVTSAIQTQINTKLSSSGLTNTRIPYYNGSALANTTTEFDPTTSIMSFYGPASASTNRISLRSEPTVNTLSFIRGATTDLALTSLSTYATINHPADLYLQAYNGTNTSIGMFTSSINFRASANMQFTVNNVLTGLFSTAGMVMYKTVDIQGASSILYAQGGVEAGGLALNASAILQADSTTKGFLPPRMTNAQRTAITSPAIGLMVYCTDATEGLYIYKSTGWTFII